MRCNRRSVAADRSYPGERGHVTDALAYASARPEPAVKTLALLGVAEGLLDRLGAIDRSRRFVVRPTISTIDALAGRDFHTRYLRRNGEA